MNVKRLKEIIEFYPDEMEVTLEGCDCTNAWNGRYDICKHEKFSPNGRITLKVDRLEDTL